MKKSLTLLLTAVLCLLLTAGCVQANLECGVTEACDAYIRIDMQVDLSGMQAYEAQEIRDGLDLIAVVLGSLSSSERFTAATTLLDYGFAAYAAVPLPAMEDRPLLIKVKGSAEESVPLDYTALPETLLMPKENAAALTAQLDLPQELEAPVQLGQTVGTVRILSGETQLGEYEVRAAADAEKMDFGTAFGLLWDALTGCES